MSRYTISSAKLTALFNLLENHGVMDRKKFLKSIDIDDSLADDPDNKVTFSELEKIICRATEITGDHFLGLHHGEFIDHTMANILGYIMMNCRTVDEVVVKYCKYEEIVNNISKTYFNRDGKTVTITVTMKQSFQFFSRYFIEYTFAAILNYITILTGWEITAREISFTHSEPDDISEYKRIFQCPVKFNHHTNSMVFSEEYLAVTTKEPNEKLLNHLEEYAQNVINNLYLDRSLTRKASDIIISHLPGEVPPITEVANRLSMSHRYLQTRLKDEGSSYRIIVDTIRKESAYRYLADKNIPITDIAYLLGFSEPSVFQKAFKKWTGKTPSQFRKSL